MKKYIRNLIRNVIVKNYLKTKHKKNALVVYTIAPFRLRAKELHTNFQESRAIVSILNEFSYNVDIVNWDDPRKIDYSRYDLLFGFGLAFENSFDSSAKPCRVYYATGAHVCYQNHAELLRILSVNKTRGSVLKPKRTVPWTWSKSTTLSDALIVIGNKWTADTYRKISDQINIYSINATALVNQQVAGLSRDLGQAKKNYLWFGSAGFVHKGLDLCLEYFAQRPDLNLHICGIKEDDFFQVYEKELSLPNVEFHGFIDIKSDRYLKLVECCCFSIMPSCSEGQSTALLTTMAAGLIPIGTAQTGIDIERIGGILINDTTLDAVAESVQVAEKLGVDDLRARADGLMGRLSREYSLQAYKNNLKKLLSKIL